MFVKVVILGKPRNVVFASATVILYLYKEQSRNLSHYNSRRRLIRRCLVDLIIVSALMSRQYLRDIFYNFIKLVLNFSLPSTHIFVIDLNYTTMHTLRVRNAYVCKGKILFKIDIIRYLLHSQCYDFFQRIRI